MRARIQAQITTCLRDLHANTFANKLSRGPTIGYAVLDYQCVNIFNYLLYLSSLACRRRLGLIETQMSQTSHSVYIYVYINTSLMSKLCDWQYFFTDLNI